MADKSTNEMNVAFKVTWVYGEPEPWSTPCSPDGRQTNILKDKKVWCMRSSCRPLLGTDERLSVDAQPCYDYRAWHDCFFSSGVYHHGDRADLDIPMKRAGVGKFAFLTSRKHGTREAERVIIACFRVDYVGPDPDWDGVIVRSDEDSPYALRVPLDRLHRAPRYWDFRPKHLDRKWGSGLFRYVPDDEAREMRLAVAELCEGVSTGVWEDTEDERAEEEYLEGRRSERLVSYYERNPQLRTAAIEHHGTVCQVCGFDFGKRYGARGDGYIEAHHLRSLASYDGPVNVDPILDMAVVCANCHRMIHRRASQPLTLGQLREILRG